MTDDTISIEVDGKPLAARKGAMIIEVADQAGIHIPRFCYHAKLSIAANCRMCLVEVEKAPKPMPACATPVMDGMKVYTRSAKALAGQKATMEFLLINHPLDCPICDQGGECELQDVAMGYGSGVSRFSERKRVVADKDIGPLIATEMTRCIHCTRCVRFGDEIAGMRELGATGRGEDLEIGTYVQHSMTSELSGNVIDLCPVGALTAKPSRYRARAWELVQHQSVAPHDSVGSNVFMHSIHNRITRVVPRDNEQINESWLSDRDRFSYTALDAEDRAIKPLLRDGQTLREVDWERALEGAVAGLRRVLDEHGPEAVGVLISPQATLEEMYLAQKLARGLNIANVDHRLRQLSSDNGQETPVYPWLGQSLADLQRLDAALLIGSNIRMEQPLAGLRIRKAALGGGRIAFLNGYDYDFRFPLSNKLIVAPQDWVRELASVARAVAEHKHITDVPGVVTSAPMNNDHQALARDLIEGERATVLLGPQAMNHPQAAELRRLAAWTASAADCGLGYLPEASNSVGGWLAGAVPHRLPAGGVSDPSGLSAMEMFAQPRRAYVLLGVEPDLDCAAPGQASDALHQAEFVVTLASWASESTLELSNVVLPSAAPSETAGTWVNLEGRWQTVPGAVSPPGEARPAWKILRVLGNLFDVSGFDYLSAEEVVNEVFSLCREVQPDNRLETSGAVEIGESNEQLHRGGDTPIYALDAMVRRAAPLQATPLAQTGTVRLNRATAAAHGCEGHDQVVVHQNGHQVVLPVVVDENVPDRCAWIPGGVAGTESLGPLIGSVRLTNVG